jgi:hypothetical protein
MLQYLKEYHTWFIENSDQPSFTLYEDIFILCSLKLNQAKLCERGLQDIMSLLKCYINRASISIKKRIDKLTKCRIEQLI